MTDLWSGIGPIGLEQLNRVAALQNRVDRKHVVPSHVIENLIDDLSEDVRVLEIDGQQVASHHVPAYDGERKIDLDGVRPNE